jgi:hypothetical protein
MNKPLVLILEHALFIVEQAFYLVRESRMDCSCATGNRYMCINFFIFCWKYIFIVEQAFCNVTKIHYFLKKILID